MKISEIDIFDINIVYKMQHEQPPKREQPLAVIIADRIKKTASLFSVNKKEVKVKSKSDVLFFGASGNNQRSFKTVLENIETFSYTSLKDDNDYPFIKSIYLSIPYIGSLIKQYRKTNYENKKLIKTYPLQYLFVYGKLRLALKIISDFKPKLLVLANDHSPMNRCLLRAAQNNKVKTLYLQHASVTTKFPDLEFDYSFLDGLESFEKYGCKSKVNSKVLLIGASRMDSFYINRTPGNKNKIGISINQFDSFDKVKELCESLKQMPYSIIVRPHPNMINWNREWFEANGIEYSDSSTIAPSEYLRQLRIQVSNICGIHLDAAIMRIPSIQYQLSKYIVEDQYDYFKNGLVIRAANISILKRYIENPHELLPNNTVIQYYMASFETKREGFVGKFIAEYIDVILDNNKSEELFEVENEVKVYTF